MQWKEPEKGKRRKEEVFQPAKIRKKENQDDQSVVVYDTRLDGYGPHHPQDEGSPSCTEQAL